MAGRPASGLLRLTSAIRGCGANGPSGCLGCRFRTDQSYKTPEGSR
jgi:hypothetical protein